MCVDASGLCGALLLGTGPACAALCVSPCHHGMCSGCSQVGALPVLPVGSALEVAVTGRPEREG